jgi:hypothetical protein
VIFLDEYPVDTRVRFEIEGTVTSENINVTGRNNEAMPEWRVRADDGCIHYIYMHPANTTVIELAEPASWPPQVGDVWEAGGVEYYVRMVTYNNTVIVAPFEFGSNAGRSYYEAGANEFEQFKALKPKLVRRREPKPSLSDTIYTTLRSYGGRFA